MLKKFRGRPRRFQTARHDRFFKEIQVEFLVHELKDPVAVIETTLRALVDHKDTYGPLNDRQEATLKRALLSSKKIRQMLFDLLEIGRGQAESFTFRKFLAADVVLESLIAALEVQTYPVFEEFEAIKNPAAGLKRLATFGIHFSAGQKVKRLQIAQDEAKFRQIITNLVKNALYHRNALMVVRVSTKASQLIVTVEDDGPGVAPEHHELIFSQYKRIDGNPQFLRSGHGLGLAGARILARSLGGDIKLVSQLGRGAIFYVNLPIKPEAA